MDAVVSREEGVAQNPLFTSALEDSMLCADNESKRNATGGGAGSALSEVSRVDASPTMIRMSTLMLQSPNWPNPTKIEGGAASGPAEESAQKTPADFPSGLSPLCTSKSEYSTRLVDDSSEGHVNRGLARSAQSERPGDHTSPALKRMSTLMLQSPNWPNPTKIEGGAASGPAEESAQKTPAGTSVYGQNPLYAGLEDGLSCTDDESNGDSDLGNAGSSLSQDLVCTDGDSDLGVEGNWLSQHCGVDASPKLKRMSEILVGSSNVTHAPHAPGVVGVAVNGREKKSEKNSFEETALHTSNLQLAADPSVSYSFQTDSDGGLPSSSHSQSSGELFRQKLDRVSKMMANSPKSPRATGNNGDAVPKSLPRISSLSDLVHERRQLRRSQAGRGSGDATLVWDAATPQTSCKKIYDPSPCHASSHKASSSQVVGSKEMLQRGRSAAVLVRQVVRWIWTIIAILISSVVSALWSLLVKRGLQFFTTQGEAVPEKKTPFLASVRRFLFTIYDLFLIEDDPYSSQNLLLEAASPMARVRRLLAGVFKLFMFEDDSSSSQDVPEKTESLLARVRRLLASVYYFFQVKHAPRSSDAALLPKAAGLVGAPADLAESTSKPVTVTEEAAPPTAAVRAEEASSEEARGIMPPVSLQSKQKPTVPQMRTWQLTWKTQGPEWLEEGASGKKSVNVVSLHAMSKLAAKVVEEKQPLRQLQIAVEARSGDKRQGEEKEELAKLLGAIPVKLLEAIDKERPSLNTPSRAVDDLDEEGALDWQKRHRTLCSRLTKIEATQRKHYDQFQRVSSMKLFSQESEWL
ncbi:hypothetical protein CYMTET_52529 [Cymbomonas tetramitiformis]|uniref:Uncharacterized protein n=1 Tax=Cymbomonas tetramitiformis TaxID=36881 RepID=A0AAE0BJ35_9CHLO|nr:hypothetical protein CYMTET_52529 [Cymbomonas tetramitiformis]